MNTVATIKPQLMTIQCPDALRNLQGWLIWRFEDQPEGEGKPRKVPYYTSGGRRHGVQGRPEDRNQLTTFDAARASAAKRGFDGVGLALMPDFGIVAGDFDNCMKRGGVHPEVQAIVAGTYAEFSPSGEGVRAFWRGNLGNQKSIGVEPFGFEAFSSKGFVTFTGNTLPDLDLTGADNTVLDAPDNLRALCTQRFGKINQVDLDDPLMSYEPPIGLTHEQIAEALDVLDADSPHSTWLNVGMAIHHETEGDGFELWNAWSANGSKYPGEEALQKRWDSFGSASGRVVTARSLIKLAHENGYHMGVNPLSDFDTIEPTTATSTERFPIVQAGAFTRGARPGWIIKGMLPRADLAVLFGESGSGKTFMILDMVLAVARGIEWRNLRTKQGRVVYIAAEGSGGVRNRLDAYAQQNEVDLDTLPFGVIHESPNFLITKDAVDVARAIKAWGGADIIVVDTLAQVTPGANENGAEDMGKALSHCKKLARVAGALVILVHHSGKDSSKGSRGWSGLRAAADAEIEVVRTAMGRSIRVSKQKDGRDGEALGFDLNTVQIGFDEDGDPVDSCVVIEAEVPVANQINNKKLGEWEKVIVEVVAEFSIAQSEGIEIKAVIDEAVRRREAPGKGKRDNRKTNAKRALLRLSEGDDALYLLEDDCLGVL